jgi:hypothetical protein
MLAGLLAGLLVFGFAEIFGEPQINRVIGFEAAIEAVRAKAQGGPPAMAEPELVSRTVQASIGLFTGVVVHATALGGLLALVFAVADRRVVDLAPRGGAALLAAAGFVAVYAVPSLKYPASPPAVGDPATIGQRTGLYFMFLALSVVAMIVAAVLRRRLVPRLGGWNAALAACGFYLLAVGVAAAVLPAVDEVPDGFPATVLWQFRVVSFGMQLLMWAVIGLAFGAFAESAMAHWWRVHGTDRDGNGLRGDDPGRRRRPAGIRRITSPPG